MDRSYLEYSQIVESFITRQFRDDPQQANLFEEPRAFDDSNQMSGAAEIDSKNIIQLDGDRERRMKQAFINVLREEMPN